MRKRLDKVSIGSWASGSSYIRVYADSADWEKFQTFSFVVWSRVPGAC